MAMSDLLGFPKLVLISLGILSIAIATNSSILPSAREFVMSRFPALRSTVLAWLKPPYLFVVLNGIILVLAASAKLFDRDAGVLVSPAPATPAVAAAADSADEEDTPAEEVADDFEEKQVVVVEDYSDSGIGRDGGDSAKDEDMPAEEVADDFDEKQVGVVEDYSDSGIGRDGGYREAAIDHEHGEARSMVRSPVRVLRMENFVEDNPPRLVRGKSVIHDDEGNTRALRESKSQRYSSSEPQTMESVWRAITSAEAKNSDTLGGRTNRRAAELPVLPPVRPRKELSTDELNRQAEEFITKFNAEMRLQREESLRELHRKGIISPGA